MPPIAPPRINRRSMLVTGVPSTTAIGVPGGSITLLDP